MMLKNPKYSAAFRQILEDMEALRRKMDIDDEIYTEIQLRVGKINDLKKVLEQKDQKIEQKDQKIEQKDQEIERQVQEIERKDQEIERKDQEIEQKKRLIAALKQQLDA
ncbi:MAG: hypothetical protein RIR11_5034 [Bacteroidota bacterium]|jgi:uncharacterized protein (DUF3084 family)